MAQIVSINKIPVFKKEAKIVLAGGCFDILHPGHALFLEEAKKWGDILIVLLESDQKVKKLKGPNRPIHTQKMRAKVLAALRAVDYIITLPYMKSDTEYDKLLSKIKPDVIAVTSKDADTANHKRAAKLVGAKLVCVTKKISNHSTSRILEGI